MDKTVITVSGKADLVTRLLPGLNVGLPAEAVEWKRSFGRAPKTVVLSAEFVPQQPDSPRVMLMASGDSSRVLRGAPILNTFWIECQDLDAYKAYAKEEVLAWLGGLGLAAEWMVVVVEAADARKANKLLPRTSVVDKLKADTGTKQPDRCIALLDPTKNDSRSSESWQALLQRLRQLTLQAYNRILGRFEDNMRSMRERRNEPQWNFCEYFLLQEELAFTYEMLGIYDEALVQYDELDALFTQFVLNSNVTESPDWLRVFSQQSYNWSGISLNPRLNRELRQTIVEKRPSLLDLRNYLFSRQCAMLLKVHKPYEMAQRSLSFLHNCVQEISILEISYPSGSIACWVFLSCLEILLTCEQYSDSSNKIQYYCLFTASLWAYARKKLFELGQLCGLMPNMNSTSEHLHRVVELSSGIRDDQYVSSSSLTGSGKRSLNPVEKLKEALSSKTAFQTYYLELSELAISTYKHIGRIRSARFIGIDLAKFYLLLGQTGQAVTFLLDGLKTFQAEGWRTLELQTLREVAECYRKLGESEKLARTLVQIASFPEEEDEERRSRFKEAMDIVKDLSESELTANGDSLLSVSRIELNHETEKIIPDSRVSFELNLVNHLPCALDCEEIVLYLQYSAPVAPPQPTSEKKSVRKTNSTGGGNVSIKRTPSVISGVSSSNTATAASEMELCEQQHPADENRLLIVEQLDYKQDRSLSSARLVCRNAAQVLRRKDSSGVILKGSDAFRSSDEHALRSGGGIRLEPGGENRVTVSAAAAGPVGRYTVGQLSVRVANMDLLCHPTTTTPVSFEVVCEEPGMFVTRIGEQQELWTGVEQVVKFSLYTGSFSLEESTRLSLRCSRGLTGSQLGIIGGGGNDVLSPNFEVVLPAGKPFQTVNALIVLHAELPVVQSAVSGGANYKDLLLMSGVEHKLTISEPWSSSSSSSKQPTVVPLHFSSPFLASVRLSTAYEKKFVEVRLRRGDKGGSFQFWSPHMKITDEKSDSSGYGIKLINDEDGVVEVTKDHDCTFFFQLEFATADSSSSSSNSSQLKLEFSVQYQQMEEDGGVRTGLERTLRVSPELRDFKTLYLLSSRVTPVRMGGEVCRAATICSLTLELEKVNETEHTSLMYEVLADQAVWAVCGRAAAVIDMSSSRKQSLVVEVMPLVGGHLPLPKVRLSKYIPSPSAVAAAAAAGGSSADSGGSSSSLPRLEPFAPGQIFNSSRFLQIHVLSSNNSTNNGNNSPSSSGPLSGFQSLTARTSSLVSGAISLP